MRRTIYILLMAFLAVLSVSCTSNYELVGHYKSISTERKYNFLDNYNYLLQVKDGNNVISYYEHNKSKHIYVNCHELVETKLRFVRDTKNNNVYKVYKNGNVYDVIKKSFW